jgi:hypothetical protein
MKKTVISIFLGLSAICGYAQTAYDALLFSENNYEGTARTMAMGNAFTALGGDLGSVGINPAGSAVAGYSQITLTPSLTFSASTTQGVSPYSDGHLPYFERQMKSRMTDFGMPNIGFTVNYDTNRSSGIRNFTFGFIVNKTAGWNEDVYAAGTNSTTSFMGSMAYDATISGLTGTELGAAGAFDRMPWKPVVGYNSGMISTFGGYDDQFVGASEVIYDNGDVALGGPLNQSYGRRVDGGKYDYLINMGANISDFIYIGANIGISSLDYTYNEYFKETAVDPSDFEIALSGGETIYFDEMKYKYAYSASGTGYYGKIGVIVTPGGGFRIGAAIQTPTINTITEEWQQSGETSYTDGKYDASSSSPYGRGSYRMVSPSRVNFGVAYALGQLGVISADYEVSDYSQMRYKSSDYDRDYFESVNEEIMENFRASHMLRLGLEAKPLPELAVRAGYSMATSPERCFECSSDIPAIRNQNVSFGLGYSSQNSFFADLAVRRTFLQDEYFMPYADYMYDADGYLNENAYAPEILNERSLWKVLVTFGWRF